MKNLNELKQPIISLLNISLGSIISFFFLFIVPSKYPLVSLIFLLIGVAAISGGICTLLGYKIGLTVLKFLCYFSFSSGTILSLIFLTSATYLAGIYGRMGVTASGIFLFFIFITVVLLIILPGIQLYYLKRVLQHED